MTQQKDKLQESGPPSTDEDNGIKLAVGLLRESVTGLLQVLDGGGLSFKLSQESMNTVSACKSDLHSLLHGRDIAPQGSDIAPQGSDIGPQSSQFTSGDGFPASVLEATGNRTDGHEYWHLQARPQTWKVKRKMLLTSPVQRFLDRHRYFEKFTLGMMFVTTILYAGTKKMGTEVEAEYTNNEGRVFTAIFVRPSMPLYAAFNLFMFASCVLVTHRLNKQLFFIALFSFEGAVCGGTMAASGLIFLWNFHSTLGDRMDPLWANPFHRVPFGSSLYGCPDCHLRCPQVRAKDRDGRPDYGCGYLSVSGVFRALF